MVSEKSPKERLDKLLVDQGLCDTRSRAQGLILSGNVLVNDRMVDKPGTLCKASDAIRLKERLKYVSRGGLKLEKALNIFSIPVSGRVCLDVGASTGGFTDCMLQAGAALVYAVDVGYGQIDWKLREDPRFLVLEKTHILELPLEFLNPPPTLGTIDVSFISLKKVIPKVLDCLSLAGPKERADLVALVKPQFEFKDYCSDRSFKGVVTHPQQHEAILSGLITDLLPLMPSWTLSEMTESPIQGPKGNREFIFYFHRDVAASTAFVPYNGNIFEAVQDLVFKRS